jgi:hypothetical protein
MNGKCLLIAAAVVGVVGSFTVSAQAWIITQVEPDLAAGNSVAVAVPLGQGPGQDFMEIHKFYIRDNSEFPDPLILSFTREEGDQDVIAIVDEMILNLQTAQARTWDEFHVALITDPNVTFRGGSVEWLDPASARAYKQTGGASRIGGVPASFTLTQINWDDSNQPIVPGSWSSAPSNQLVLRGMKIDVGDVGVGEGFLLKEWPGVLGLETPEPATLALVVMGAGGLLLRRRRR